MIEAKQTRFGEEEHQRAAQEAQQEQERLKRQADRGRRAAEEDAGKTAARNERLRQKWISVESKRRQVVVGTQAVTQRNGTQNANDLLTASLIENSDNGERVRGGDGAVETPVPPTPPPPPQQSDPPRSLRQEPLPPPITPPVQQHTHHVIHRCIPHTFYGKPLKYFAYMDDILRLCSKRHSFD